MLDGILYEARRDIAKQGGLTPKGEPEGIPMDPSFLKSFSYKVDGHSIHILSSWPTIRQVVEGRMPYKMKWLTQQRGVDRVPFGKDALGQVIVRMTPKTTADAWIHPGFKKHDFIDRGIKRAKTKIRQLLQDQVRMKIASRRYL